MSGYPWHPSAAPQGSRASFRRGALVLPALAGLRLPQGGSQRLVDHMRKNEPDTNVESTFITESTRGEEAPDMRWRRGIDKRTESDVQEMKEHELRPTGPSDQERLSGAPGRPQRCPLQCRMRPRRTSAMPSWLCVLLRRTHRLERRISSATEAPSALQHRQLEGRGIRGRPTTLCQPAAAVRAFSLFVLARRAQQSRDSDWAAS